MVEGGGGGGELKDRKLRQRPSMVPSLEASHFKEGKQEENLSGPDMSEKDDRTDKTLAHMANVDENMKRSAM